MHHLVRQDAGKRVHVRGIRRQAELPGYGIPDKISSLIPLGKSKRVHNKTIAAEEPALVIHVDRTDNFSHRSVVIVILDVETDLRTELIVPGGFLKSGKARPEQFYSLRLCSVFDHFDHFREVFDPHYVHNRLSAMDRHIFRKARSVLAEGILRIARDNDRKQKDQTKK